MGLLQEKDKEYIRNLFSNLENEVTISNFTQEIECQYCRETREILEELAELSDKIKLNVYNFVTDKEIAEKYAVDKIPATVIEGKEDYGIRYYGIPSGYEFSSIIEDIVDVSKGDSGLSPESRELLKQIDAPLRLQVFVTPTCPYCPRAVRLAHKMAIENPYIVADMVEATEFPHLSMRYNVRGVPRTVVGEDHAIEGALPEKQFIENIVNYFKTMKK
ncbi:protein disulfide oxidoreductase [Caldithrix abyssi]|uniref:Glutaredoxin-like domain protein n=1 Tax=Caldithrix abyssi DSM 13497 TaxID=880073 RepID=H1XXX9_CALAY|nr:thioredoxin family protein [Caldithrix abyssi]APF20645.1 Glutaredoxin-like domain protein [Caldithrix abyssi DSM 13497]EHO40854.1 glutaredoxin-like domain protein [Caldithrix abyssi DSM 13497]